ncbi:MAG: glycosyltransferase [Candidatus Hodarchaeales archaeon]|jgi:glycosyltransferase involved in cell wall biosynthesis
MKNIVFVGQITDISGYGNAARSYLKSLIYLHKQKQIDLRLINNSYENVQVSLDSDIEELIIKQQDYASLLEEEYELIFFLTNNSMLIGQNSKEVLLDTPSKRKYINLNLLCQRATKIYPCVVWETDKVPAAFSSAYSRFSDKIECLLCACSWNEETFSKQTGFNTTTIPYSIQKSEEYDPKFLKKIENIKQDKFTFVSLSQWSYRKGFDKLIKAFLLEFKNEPVNLILKTYIGRAFDNSDETRIVSQKIENEKKKLSFNGAPYQGECSIVVVNSILNSSEINSLYAAADCMVSCTRGEGFGLPIAEFLSFNKPVIVPDKGGHLDFCSKDNFFINSTLEPFENCPNPLYSSDMNLIEVSLSSTMKKMREVYNLYKNDKVSYNSIGKKCALYSDNYLSLEANIEAFRKTLGLQ